VGSTVAYSVSFIVSSFESIQRKRRGEEFDVDA
jgi:hypothetical protein